MDVPYEQQIGNALYQNLQEKSFIDKTLAKNEVEEIKEIMQKDELNRSDLLKLLYLMSANESKLVNFDDMDRYILGKFYTWIRDFVAIAEGFYDYENYLETNKAKFLPETLEGFKNAKKLILHDAKFLADIYFFLSRSTLSLEATAFEGILKNRFEYSYSGIPSQVAQPEQKKGLLNMIWKR